MSDYISRQAAIEAVDECTKLKITDDFYTVYTEDMKDMIADIPAADVRENVKGEWTEEEHADFYINATFSVVHCNRCDYRTPRIDGLSMNFCPNCGADMRGGGAE